MRQPMPWRIPAIGVFLLLTAACSTTTGSGPLRTEQRNVSGFSTVQLTTPGDVQIQQTGTESLTVEAQHNLLPRLTRDVADGTLRLSTLDGANIVATQPITYRLSVKNLAGLQSSGSGNQVAHKITTNSLIVDISGSGDITIDGVTDTQNVTISAPGTITLATWPAPPRSLNSAAAVTPPST